MQLIVSNMLKSSSLIYMAALCDTTESAWESQLIGIDKHATYGLIGETWRLHLSYEYKMIDTKVSGKRYILFYFTRV